MVNKGQCCVCGGDGRGFVYQFQFHNTFYTVCTERCGGLLLLSPLIYKQSSPEDIARDPYYFVYRNGYWYIKTHPRP